MINDPFIPEPVLSAVQLQLLLGEPFPDSGVPIVESVTNTGVIVSLPIGERHSRPGGTVAGPVMMSLADTTAWMATLSRIGPVVLAVTTSLHIDFLRKPALRDLVATGDLLKLGSRLAIVDVTIRSEGLTAPVAKAQVTYSIPPKQDRTRLN
jgi:uncharacterized protein (TIGR00369 family)